MAVESLEDLLSELRDRPGVWRFVNAVDDEAAARQVIRAFRDVVLDRERPEEIFVFEYREAAPDRYEIFVRHEPPDVWDLDYERNRQSH